MQKDLTKKRLFDKIEKKEKDTEKEHEIMTANMTIKTASMTPAAQTFNPALFTDFIKWIDRGEKTTRSYINNLKQFMAWMRFSCIDNPIRQDIINYRDWLTREHEAIRLDTEAAAGYSFRTDASGNPLRIMCKPNTIALYLRSVCQFFKWAAANNLYPDIAANIHAPKIKHDVHKKDALTAADVLAIENSITANAEQRAQAAAASGKDTAGRIQRNDEQGKRLYAMYLLAVNAGLRTIELSRANIKDLETKGGQTWLYIWGKGHSEPDQKKPIAHEVHEAIKDYIASRTDKPTGTSPLFVSTGNRSGGKRIAATTISTMLKKAMQAAGYDSERITAHSLRHTAGTAVQELTGDIYTTQKYMRHSNPATTEIYLHNETEKAEAGIAQRLYNLYHGADHGDSLEQILDGLTPEQIAKLADLVKKTA